MMDVIVTVVSMEEVLVGERKGLNAFHWSGKLTNAMPLQSLWVVCAVMRVVVDVLVVVVVVHVVVADNSTDKTALTAQIKTT